MADIQENVDIVMRVLNGAKTVTEIEKVNGAIRKSTYSLNKATGAVDKSYSEVVNKLPRFKMEYLSIMFMSMQVERAVGSLFQSAAQIMTKIQGYTSAWTIETMKLGAAWDFLQFRLLDVLGNSALFKFIVDTLIWVVDAISGLDNTQIEALAIALGALFAISITSFWLASFGLFLGGLQMLITTMGGAGALTALTNLGLLAKIGMITIGLTLTGLGLADFISSLGSRDLGKELKAALETGLGVALVAVALGAGAAGGILAFTLTVGIMLVIQWLWDTRGMTQAEMYKSFEGERLPDGTPVMNVDVAMQPKVTYAAWDIFKLFPNYEYDKTQISELTNSLIPQMNTAFEGTNSSLVQINETQIPNIKTNFDTTSKAVQQNLTDIKKQQDETFKDRVQNITVITHYVNESSSRGGA